MVASLVEGEVLVAANGSSYVSEYVNLTCFSITRIQILVTRALQGVSRENLYFSKIARPLATEFTNILRKNVANPNGLEVPYKVRQGSLSIVLTV